MVAAITARDYLRAANEWAHLGESMQDAPFFLSRPRCLRKCSGFDDKHVAQVLDSESDNMFTGVNAFDLFSAEFSGPAQSSQKDIHSTVKQKHGAFVHYVHSILIS